MRSSHGADFEVGDRHTDGEGTAGNAVEMCPRRSSGRDTKPSGCGAPGAGLRGFMEGALTERRTGAGARERVCVSVYVCEW